LLLKQVERLPASGTSICLNAVTMLIKRDLRGLPRPGVAGQGSRRAAAPAQGRDWHHVGDRDQETDRSGKLSRARTSWSIDSLQCKTYGEHSLSLRTSGLANNPVLETISAAVLLIRVLWGHRL